MKAVIIIFKSPAYGSRQEQDIEIVPNDIKCVVDWQDRHEAIEEYLKEKNIYIDTNGYIRENNYSDFGYIYGICKKTIH